MKFFVALVLAVACAHADVSHIVGRSGEAAANIVKFQQDVQPDAFNYHYETDNGIRSTANGILKNVNAENPAQEITGEFSYPGPDGVNYAVTFVANENGYQPQGAHLPTAPPVPEAIQRALAYNAAHPQVEAKQYSSVNAPVPHPVVTAYKAPSTFPAFSSAIPGSSVVGQKYKYQSKF